MQAQLSERVKTWEQVGTTRVKPFGCLDAGGPQLLTQRMSATGVDGQRRRLMMENL